MYSGYVANVIMRSQIKYMNKVGAPSKIDEITLKKLEDAFSNDATDIQACFLANKIGRAHVWTPVT